MNVVAQYLLFIVIHVHVNRRVEYTFLLVCAAWRVYRGIIGHGVSQFRSRLLKCSIPLFTRFRNPVDRQVMQSVQNHKT